ncbi:MAG: hemG, partial [Chlamydiales bacterium]|nr:hemG [Chlamydiales bacterium]
MAECDIAILGGGISGLASAWFLKRRFPSKKILIFEAQSRAGGWVHTEHKEGFYFETGPKSCRSRRSGLATLELALALGLQEAVLPVNKRAKERYILWEGRLEPLPTKLSEFFKSPLTREMLLHLLKEPFSPLLTQEDSSIREVLEKKLGSAAVQRLVAPFVTGIFAGDVDRLSFKSCFPEYAELLQKKSLLRLLLRPPKEVQPTHPWLAQMRQSPLFSFQKGMGQLAQALAEDLGEDLLLGHVIEQVQKERDSFHLQTPFSSFKAHRLISALPSFQLAPLVAAVDPHFSTLLNEIPFTSLALVHLGYEEEVLTKPGFGYLVPPMLNSNLLGIVFDSNVFPRGGCQLSVMLKMQEYPESKDEFYLQEALKAVFQHLNIAATPKVTHITRARRAIPQDTIGHSERLK